MLGETEQIYRPHPDIILNFHPNGERGFYPDRVYEHTPQLDALFQIINAYTPQMESVRHEEASVGLHDLIVHNCYGKLCKSPEHSGYFVGVMDFTDNIVLIKEGNHLALAGGYRRQHEAITQTIARKADERIHTSTASHFVLFSEKSKPIRNPSSHTIATCGSGVIHPDELSGSRDPATNGAVVVPLVLPDGSINDSFFSSSRNMIDEQGRTVSHNGLRADHRDMLVDFYHYIQSHRKAYEHVCDTVRRMSHAVSQDMFRYQKKYVPIVYDHIIVGHTQLTLTPNIKRALDIANNIFAITGYKDHTERAKQFVADCVYADILPLVPEPETLLNCVIIEDDTILVEQTSLKDGSKLMIPHMHYSLKEGDETRSFISHISEYIYDQHGLDAREIKFFSTTGGNENPETNSLQYPHIAYTYVMTRSRARVELPQKTKQGHIVFRIPIWEDKTKGIVSQEVRSGILGAGWVHDQNKHILLPLVIRYIRTMDPRGQLTAEQVLRR